MNAQRDVDHLRSEGAFSPVPASPLAGLDVLRESEARFRASFELAPVGLAHVGIGGEWLAVNARLCELLGYTRDELLATSFQAITHPDDLAVDLHHAHRLVAGELESYTMPKRYLRKDSTVVWARLTRSLVRDAGGAPFHFLSVVDEIAGPELERMRGDADETERLAAALTAAHDGAYDWNVPTGAVHFSEQWCRMLGYAPGEIAPQYTSWEVRVHPDDLPGALAALETHLDAHSALYEIEHRMRRKDGSWAWVLSRGEVVARDGEGRPLRMVGTHKDITALKRAEAAHALRLAREEAAHAAADAARARAEDTARTKSALLATMSHELRTPLNAIAGHVQLLEMGIHGPVTAAQTDALRRVDLAQRHLLRLVNDILDLARLEAHGISYDLKAVSLAEVVTDLDPLVGPQACAKGVSLTTDVDRACVVRADRDKLVQLLLNLVSNAVKFTDAGGTVTIESATRAASGDDPGVVHLRVRDTGIGIPADRLEYIFDPYAQMDTTSAGQAAGTGLGLAISRNLARGMGGDIRARSTPGVGSAFTVTLPRAGA